jgi:hypothetical protein
MVSITSWLDPILSYFADKAGLARDEHNAYIGGEIVANLADIPADMFSKGWLNKVIHFVAGLIAGLYGVFGKDIPTRLRRELIAFAEHELWHIARLRPEEIRQIRLSINQFLTAVARGDWDTALSAILSTPEEISMALGLGTPTQSSAPVATAEVVPVMPAPAPVLVPVPETQSAQQPSETSEAILAVT